MKLNDAIGEMILDRKIKLPEWKGFWFIPEHSEYESEFAEQAVRVFTKEGEVLSPPWIEKYKDREDFELTDGKFNFGIAIAALKNGHRVARSGWNGKNMYLILFSGQKDIAKGLGYGFGEMMGEFSFVDVIGIKSAQNTMVLGWHPSTPDMLCEDWQLVQ